MSVPFAESAGPLDLILGLPVHPLVVHFAVVLLPLAALALIAIVIVPKWRQPFGWVVLAGLLVGTGASLLAKESGEAFAVRVGWPTEHANLGDRLPLVAMVLFVVAAVWFWLQRRQAKAGRKGSSVLTVVVGVAACILAVAASVLTVLVGHSGAAAVWSERIADPAPTSQAATTPDAAQPPALTMDEVARHASASDCWSVVNGTVYDLTSWIDQHPGGMGPIEAMCGVDATDAFVAMHGTEQVPADSLSWFLLGPLAP
jgi:uncharacterized membrane protein